MVAYILNSVFDLKKKKNLKEEASKYNNLSSKLGSNQAFKNVHQPIQKIIMFIKHYAGKLTRQHLLTNHDLQIYVVN